MTSTEPQTKFTSHFVDLPCGKSIFYVDSGAPPVPPKISYPTLVIVHGTGFTGRTFYPLLPFTSASSPALRLIIPNRPDYVPSLLLSPSELRAYNTGDPSSARANAEWLSQFLRVVIEDKGIPKINVQDVSRDDKVVTKKQGGVVILAWSMGVITALPLFYRRDWIGEEMYSFLKDYIRELVLYEPVSGHPLPPSLFSPSMKKEVYFPYTPSHPGSGPNGEDVEKRTKEEIMLDFGRWIGGYYRHPYYSGEPEGEDRDDAEDDVVKVLEGGNEETRRGYTIEDFDWSKGYERTSLDYMDVGTDIGEEEDASLKSGRLLDWAAAARVEVPEVSDFPARDRLRRELSDAVFGLQPSSQTPLPSSALSSENQSDEEAQPANLPLPGTLFLTVPITYISGTHTAGVCAWNAIEDERRWREAVVLASSAEKEGKGEENPWLRPRKTKWVRVRGGNHFMHWDMPGVFLRALGYGSVDSEGS